MASAAAVVLCLIAAMTWWMSRTKAEPEDRMHLGSLPPATVSDEQLVLWAESVLAGHCMVEQGFEFTVDWVDPFSEGPLWLPYGSDDVEAARTNGYGLGPLRLKGDSAAAAQDPNRDYLASLSREDNERFTKTMFGDRSDSIEIARANGSKIRTSRQGCLSGARRTMFGELATWVPLISGSPKSTTNSFQRCLPNPR